MKESNLTTFSELKLSEPILKALAAEGYETPTPIQAKSIPSLLEGRDLLGIAQTGTGKTAAFALPILAAPGQARPSAPARGTVRALILAPTRELASQIAESFRTYGKNLSVSRAVVFGGVVASASRSRSCAAASTFSSPRPAASSISSNARPLTLSKVEIFVLDEVDQMLDLGFIHAIRKITAMLPKQRQNLFFSATMPKEIAGLADALLSNPVRVEVAPVATTAERVNQAVIHVDPANKVKLLAELLKDNNMTRTLVFTRTKHGADKVMKHLSAGGFTAAAIHGNKSPGQPREGAGRLQGGQDPGAGRNRHRGARHRRRRRQPRGELRPALRAGILCASHRPHRAGGRHGRSHRLLHAGRSPACCATSRRPSASRFR